VIIAIGVFAYFQNNADRLEEDLLERAKEDHFLEEKDMFESRQNSGMTSAQKQRVITKHNELRMGEKAANMQRLVSIELRRTSSSTSSSLTSSTLFQARSIT